MIKWMREKLGFKDEKRPAAFAAISGNQKTTDPRLIWGFYKNWYTQFRPEERIDIWRTLYIKNPLARGIVETYVKNILTQPVFESGDAQVDDFANKLYERINLEIAIEQLVRSKLIYGYSAGEICWNDDFEITKVVVPESHDFRFISDNLGNITEVRQWNRTAPDTPVIPAQKFVTLHRDQTSTFDIYGGSIFEAGFTYLESMTDILDDQRKIFKRFGSPKYLTLIPADGLSPEQLKERMNQAETAMDNVSSEKSNIFFPVGTDVRILGSDGTIPKIGEETKLLMSIILAFSRIPASVFGVNIDGSGSESYARQSVLTWQSILATEQDRIAAAFNRSFFPLVQRFYGLPTTPRMTFLRPRLLEQTQEEAARSANRENAWAECVLGRDAEWFVRQLGAKPEEFDMSALNEQIKKARENGYQNNNKTKQPSTKETDANQSLSNAL